ncbi:MAG TPA: shikimate dehydrogenase [Micromonosporaceae bacterium]|nr:shikimate dehydrogenase [Micromonosporaceae bacterium]
MRSEPASQAGTSARRRAAVLGKPIAHSLSPVIHNAGYAACGLTDWAYIAIECAEAELADRVAGLGAEWAGLSLTMPLKEVALDVADAVDPLAAALGAANTLVRRDDGWHAYNTDTPGMVEALREAGVAGPGWMAVLGGGGTARAALGAAADLGAAVTVFARRPEAVVDLQGVADRLGVRLTAAPWSEAGRCAEADVVVCTVPKGVADDLAALPWSPHRVVFDVVYDPWPTPLAAAAQRAGCRVVSGLDLLVAQAAYQFELFTGHAAPRAAMRAALPVGPPRPT